METLNEFILMGRVGKEGIKKFNYNPPNSFNNDGSPKVKFGMEFFLEVPQSVGGGDMKVRLVTYNRTPLENLLGKFVVIKGFLKVQTYTTDEGDRNYITKLVVQENGGVIYYGSQPRVAGQDSVHENQRETSNGKLVRQVFRDEINDDSYQEDDWIDSQLTENEDIWE